MYSILSCIFCFNIQMTVVLKIDSLPNKCCILLCSPYWTMQRPCRVRRYCSYSDPTSSTVIIWETSIHLQYMFGIQSMWFRGWQAMASMKSLIKWWPMWKIKGFLCHFWWEDLWGGDVEILVTPFKKCCWFVGYLNWNLQKKVEKSTVHSSPTLQAASC